MIFTCYIKGSLKGSLKGSSKGSSTTTRGLKMNRFEIDANISKALTKAAKFGFIDVTDIFSAGTEFEKANTAAELNSLFGKPRMVMHGDFRLVAEWLMGVLYAIRRSSNPDERKEVQGHIDDFYKSIQ